MSQVYSWSRLALRTAASAVGIEGQPTKLTFVVTKRCNSRCVYCDIWKAKDTPGALDRELTLEEIQRIAQENPFFQWIDFTGGEPTDRPDLVQIVRAFANASPGLLLVHFPTNGISTKRIVDAAEEIRRTVKARLVVTVSIDGPPEINDKLRGIRNDFAHAVKSFIRVREIVGTENAFIGMTLHGYSQSCGLKTVDLMENTFNSVNTALQAEGAPSIEWPSFHVNIPHVSQHFYGNNGAVAKNGFGSEAHRAEIAEAIRVIGEKTAGSSTGAMNAIERVYRSEALKYLDTGRTSIGCAALASTAYLSEKGDLFPCTIWGKKLGNVRAEGFQIMPIIERARTDGVRTAIKEGKCPQCWTPCEAYPSIAASPGKAVVRLLRGS